MSDTRLTLLFWILIVHTSEVFNVATEAHWGKKKWLPRQWTAFFSLLSVTL